VMLIDWAALKYFKKFDTIDHWGDPNRMQAEILLRVDALRDFVGKPIFVTSGFRENDRGEHGSGNALDIVCPTLSLLDFYLSAERFGFTGLGVYPNWKWDGLETGGLHIDLRDLGARIGSNFAEFKGARWLAYKGADGKQVYTTLDKANLKRYGVI